MQEATRKYVERCFGVIVVTYKIRVFFEGAQKGVFSSILKYVEQAELKLCPNL
jgi:hypothetical protein